MKSTSPNILEDMDTTLNALLEEVAKMREMLSSVQTSLVALAFSNVKRQVQETPLTLVDGARKHKSKQHIMQKHVTLTEMQYFQQFSSKPEENQ